MKSQMIQLFCLQYFMMVQLLGVVKATYISAVLCLGVGECQYIPMISRIKILLAGIFNMFNLLYHHKMLSSE